MKNLENHILSFKTVMAIGTVGGGSTAKKEVSNT